MYREEMPGVQVLATLEHSRRQRTGELGHERGKAACACPSLPGGGVPEDGGVEVRTVAASSPACAADLPARLA
jgi:hypothetical protein